MTYLVQPTYVVHKSVNTIVNCQAETPKPAVISKSIYRPVNHNVIKHNVTRHSEQTDILATGSVLNNHCCARWETLA